MIQFKKLIPGIAWFFLVLVLICLPGDDLPQPDNWMQKIYFDKWVHAGLFGGLAFLFLRPVALSSFERKDKMRLFIKIVLAAIVWGLTTELIQKFFIPGRSFDLTDWAADITGILIAFIFTRKIYRGKMA